MKKAEIPNLKEQLAALDAMKDEDIDFSDIPEILDWTGSVRGKFYRPVKQPVTLRLDADVLAWFKNRHPKYQSAINSALRQYILALPKSGKF
ncbi:MAG: BrnA antitoxin family protein [Acidobacteriota bacterium]|jgi:uncharacterized protein (DUF4415 family)|nr:BrnA antitoxin family protein [Acidobacteriota bacterium]